MALQIVDACLELSKTDPNVPQSEQAAIQSLLNDLQSLQNALQSQLQDACSGPSGGTPTIRINPAEGPPGISITVVGDSWPANIELEIEVIPNKFRTSTNASGHFSVLITVPEELMLFPSNSVDVSATPVDPLIRSNCAFVTSPVLFTLIR